MPQAEDTLIAIVLDRSGSMQSLRQAAIRGFNDLLAEQRAQPGTARLYLAQFDHEYDIVHDGVPLDQVPPLTTASFVPRGHTALLDALGRTLCEVQALAEQAPVPARVLVVVITDGRENASREFSSTMVAELVRNCSALPGWQLMFLGTDAISVETAQSLGVASDQTLAFSATAIGIQAAFAAIDGSLRESRQGGTGTLARARLKMN
jgi:Mg-chelatase subunit ChlD